MDAGAIRDGDLLSIYLVRFGEGCGVLDSGSRCEEVSVLCRTSLLG